MKKIKLLTFNVKMLPGPGGESRAAKIADAILEKSYDIVCLQEMFDEDIREIFTGKLKKQFQSIVPKCSDGDIFNEDSGLFFASRFPMRGYDENKGWMFTEFDKHAGWDIMADKGVFGARLNLDSIDPGLTLLFFNTHLQSDEEHADVRRFQLRQISSFLSGAMKRVSKPSATAVILCGDMNVIGDVTDEYRQMLSILGYPRDAYREINKSKKGFTWDAEENLNMIPPDDHDRQRLDYIFYFDSFVNGAGGKEPLYPLASESVELQMFDTDKNSRLSDHFALECYAAGSGAASEKTVAAGKKRKRNK